MLHQTETEILKRTGALVVEKEKDHMAISHVPIMTTSYMVKL